MDNVKIFLASRRATTVLAVILFFAFSWLSYGAYIRFDLSSAGAMRISGTTKNLLRNLPEKATIELFVSNDLPDEAILIARKARDFIQEYVNSSRGKVKLIVLDPDNDKSAQARANDLHIQQLDLRVGGSKKAQAQSIYFGLAISYGSKSDTVNNLINLYEQQELENQLTAKIFKMAKPNERRIAFLAGHGNFSLKKEGSPLTSIYFFAEKVSTFYGELMEVNTTTGEIPAEVSTLLILQPGKLEPIDKFRLDQFVMRGGNLIVGASGMDVNMSQQFMASPGNPDLPNFLKNYGIELEANMINEPKPNYYVPFIQPNGFRAEKFPYPPWVVVHKENMSQDNLASKGLAALTMPFSSSVKIDNGKLPAGEGKFKVDILAKSTADSWAQANFAFLDPGKMEETLSAPKQNTGSHNLAVMVKGKFTSQYVQLNPPPEAPKTFLKAGEKDSHILVLGTPYAMSNLTYILSQWTGAPLLDENLKLVFAALDLMHGNEELVELRKKASPRIKTKLVEDGMRKFLTVMAFMIPLLGILIFGAYRLTKRRNLAPSSAA